jgi:hypothetical protein
MSFFGQAIPKIIGDEGTEACKRFLEFFFAKIRNKNTRAAYARAERVQKFGVSATIYAPKNKDKGFTVAYHVRGKLVRKVRNDYESAKQLAQSVVDQKGNGELDILTLTASFTSGRWRR